MTRFGRSNVERQVSQLAREDRAGPGLKRENGKYVLNHGDDLIETLPDKTVVLNVTRLREEIVGDSVVIRISKDGKVEFSPKSVEAPLVWNTRTGAHGLAFDSTPLKLNASNQLSVVGAAPRADSAAAVLATLVAEFNDLLAKLRAAGLLQV